MFKQLGSIASYRILAVVALITGITQIVVHRLINRISEKEDIKNDSITTKENNKLQENRIV